MSHTIEHSWHLICHLLIAILTNAMQTLVYLCVCVCLCVCAIILAIIQPNNNNQNETNKEQPNVLKLKIG